MYAKQAPTCLFPILSVGKAQGRKWMMQVARLSWNTVIMKGFPIFTQLFPESRAGMRDVAQSLWYEPQEMLGYQGTVEEAEFTKFQKQELTEHNQRN